MIAVINQHAAFVRREYGLAITDITPVAGGWSALAFRLQTPDGMFFLKVYDKKRSGMENQLCKLNLCMSAVAWLDANTGLEGRISAPLPTRRGEVKAETQSHAYLLFPYIDGVTVRTAPLSAAQQHELAAMVARLHLDGAKIPMDLSPLRENYDITCRHLLKMPLSPDDSLCVHRQRHMIIEAIEQAYTLAEYARAVNPPMVLCHADIHGWNLIQGQRLHLIDWESIRLAPAEADLYTFWGDWYWGDANWGSYWGGFLPVYQKLRPEYTVDEKLLRFYQLRRHIEDIEDFYRKYLYDLMSEAEAAEVVCNLKRECEFLAALTRE